jgi:signal transduction histidine kinase
VLNRQRAYDALERHPLASDALLAVLVGALSVAAALGGEPGSATALRPLDAAGIALLLAASAALVWRRRAPLLVFGANVALLGAYLAAEYTEDYTGYSMFVALLAVATHRNLRTAVSVGALCIGLIFVLREPHFGFVLLNVVQISAIVFAVTLGAYLRARRAYLDAVQEAARLAGRESELMRERAVAGGRGRIARELHDVVAHAMSVVVLQIGAGRLTMLRDAAGADETLGRAEATTRQALSELRLLLEVLEPGVEAGGAPPAPPGLAQLPQVLDNARHVGMRVAHHVEGTPRALSAALDLSAFRIAQEAVTNAVRHAGPGAALSVVLRYGAHALEVEVTNGPSALAAPTAATGPARVGRGLIGMRERAAVFGGQVSADPTPEGGFRVHAHLPTQEQAPDPPPGSPALM